VRSGKALSDLVEQLSELVEGEVHTQDFSIVPPSFGREAMTIAVRAATLAALVSAACCAQAAAAPTVESVPAAVTPSQTLTLQVSGFAPGERVQVELQPTADELSNGDAILAASAVLTSPDGSGEVSFVWPSGYYAPCTVACPRLPDSPWLSHQEVDIDIVGEGNLEGQNNYATTKTAIAPGTASNVWDKLTNGPYVTDVYVDTPGVGGSFSLPIPHC
jgi:hypothetical protein